MTVSRSFVVALLAAVVLATPASAHAQVSQAELRGTVTDGSGAALPGVTVTALHLETGTARTTVTSQTGAYMMPALPVGMYGVTVELTGFRKVVRENLRLAVGESAVINFSMQLASIEESVTVVGESPLVDTKSSEMAGRVDPAQIQNLPLNGRNWLDLVALVPGARGNPGNIQVGAAGSDMAKYQVDGVDVSNQCCGGSNQGYSQENIAEFQVLTNRFDAEFGRVSGAVINAISKSGTNEFRGTGFGFFRNDRFDAPNFFTGKVEPFNEKQVGANGGGPIMRNRAHFFSSYEYQIRDITVRPNTGIAAFDVDAEANVTRHYTTLRTDIQVNAAHRVFARSSREKREQLNSGVGGRTAWSAGNTSLGINHDLSVGETWVVSNRAVHEVRLGFSRIDRNIFPNVGMPRLSFPSATLGAATNSPQWWKEMNIEVKNALSYFIPSWHGEHSLKLGFQFFQPKFWGELPQVSYGSYNFNRDPIDFNDPRTYPPPTSYSQSLGDFHYTVTNPVYAGFIQDNWTLGPKLTLNLGVRYDVETGVKNTDFPNPIEPGERKTDKDNISPRLGFAYDLRGAGRTVVRGGAGRYYDKVMLNITSNERRVAQGQILSVTVINPEYGNPLQGRTFEDFKRLNLPTNTTIIGNDYATPRQDQVSIGLAQQIGSRYAVQADFVHSKGKNEPRSTRVNYFRDPATNLPLDPTIYGRPYPQYVNITRYETSAKSKYDGFQFGFSARKGDSWFQLQGSYTLSWTKDDHDGNRFTNVNNPFNLADEYAYSDEDQRHRFIVNGVAYLPWDLHLSGIFFAGSKRPISISTNLDPLRLGYTDRWLDATGRTLPRNGERTAKNDYKLDLRLSKAMRVARVSFQGILDVFNVLNTKNVTNYGTTFGSLTYLQPASSTDLFYQPRQVQLGFRISY